VLLVEVATVPVLTGVLLAETPALGAETAELVCGGIINVDPSISCELEDRPFAAASCATLRPSVAAIDDSDSPGVTV